MDVSPQKSYYSHQVKNQLAELTQTQVQLAEVKLYGIQHHVGPEGPKVTVFVSCNASIANSIVS